MLWKYVYHQENQKIYWELQHLFKAGHSWLCTVPFRLSFCVPVGIQRATRGEGEVSPALFWKLKKSVLIFGKKGLVSVHLCVEYSIQNVVLRVSRRKIPKFSLRAHFFRVFLAEFLSKYPNSVKHPLPWKFSGNAPVIFAQLVLHWRHAYALNVQWQRFMPMNTQKIKSANYLHLQMGHLLGTCQWCLRKNNIKC